MDYEIEHWTENDCAYYNEDLPEEEQLEPGYYIHVFADRLGPYKTKAQAQKKAQQIFG